MFCERMLWSVYTIDAMVREKKWVRGSHDELEKPGVMERARELFCREIEKIAQGEGQGRSWLRFYTAAGRTMEKVIFHGNRLEVGELKDTKM
jgi:hypothetical protein